MRVAAFVLVAALAVGCGGSTSGGSDSGAPGHDAGSDNGQLPDLCGNGVVDEGEACDPAAASAACCTDTCQLRPAGYVCRPGSGDDCDPDEACDGTHPACPADVVAEAGTVCRTGSGDDCDPDEKCPGVAGQACPADVVAAATTVCREGSGDACDPDEKCPGLAGEPCPDDVVAAADTVCRAGSGDVCDPPETCPGVAGQACPVDVVAPTTTVCRPGSGDLCDPDERCPGVAGQACPVDVVAAASTVCRAGSGDMCDPDEKCTGVAGQACPPNQVTGATTVCRAGSGDLCDPDEKCTGVPGQACPTDVVASTMTVCRAGSGDLCDPDEKCPGVPGQACPADVVAAASTVCRAGSGDMCDPDEKCPGVAGATCPADVITPATTVCRPGSGDLCDPDERCTGVAGQPCPNDVVATLGTPCGAALTEPTCNPDACDGEGGCVDKPVATDGTLCTTGGGNTCCTGACTDQPTPGTCDPCALPAITARRVTVTDSAGYTVEAQWQAVLAAAGHTVTIVPTSALTDLPNLLATADVLIVSSGVGTLPAGTDATIQGFVAAGRGVYLQSEYDINYGSNVAFAAAVNALGGSFSWTGTVSGSLTPTVLGCYNTYPEDVASLSYYWYGATGTGSGAGFSAMLAHSGTPVGFAYCRAGGGLLVTTSDQDWVRESNNPSYAAAPILMRNIFFRLAHASLCD